MKDCLPWSLDQPSNRKKAGIVSEAWIASKSGSRAAQMISRDRMHWLIQSVTGCVHHVET